jgi:hypothetical protein
VVETILQVFRIFLNKWKRGFGEVPILNKGAKIKRERKR